MTRVVYKYPLLVQTRQELALPLGFKIIDSRLQNDNPMIWCLVDPEETRMLEVPFVLIATGEELDGVTSNSHKYVGSYHTKAGFIFHLFEKEARKMYTHNEFD